MKLSHDTERQLAAMTEDEGLELLAIEVVGSGSKTILRLVVDGPDGVTLDDCATISRQASALLDVDDPASHAYSLEVSSPGVERKLYSRNDYERFSGRRVKIRMQPSYRDLRVAAGELVGIDGDTIRLRIDSSELLELPFEEVFETRLDVDWSEIMKEGKTRP
jgi:ribosome maturation factor RimP